MEPSLREGDVLVATRWFHSSWLARERLVVFWPTDFVPSHHRPLGVEQPPIKRIAGMPGDPLPTLQSKDAPQGLRIPSGRYWLLGDNARRSVDSRTWGPIARHQMLAMVLFQLPRHGSLEALPAAPPPPQAIGWSAPRQLKNCRVKTLDGQVRPLRDRIEEGMLIIHVHPRISESLPVLSHFLADLRGPAAPSFLVLCEGDELSAAHLGQILNVEARSMGICLDVLLDAQEAQQFPACYRVSRDLTVLQNEGLPARSLRAGARGSGTW